MSDILFAPWRLDYIKNVSDGPGECFLCSAAKNPDGDVEKHVVARTSACLLMLNRYPYVNGHLLIAPYRHAAQLTDIGADERAQLIELLAYGQTLLANTLNPQGFNMGFNIGRCAGAGVPGHVHAHIVPRWNGDTNFMSVVGKVRIIPQALEDVFGQLKLEHEKLAKQRGG